MVTLAAKRVQAAIFWLLSRGSSALDLSDPGKALSSGLRVLTPEFAYPDPVRPDSPLAQLPRPLV